MKHTSPFTFLNKTSIGELLWNFAYENITHEISVLFKISDFFEVTLFLIKLIQTSEFDLLKCLCFISKNIQQIPHLFYVDRIKKELSSENCVVHKLSKFTFSCKTVLRMLAHSLFETHSMTDMFAIRNARKIILLQAYIIIFNSTCPCTFVNTCTQASHDCPGPFQILKLYLH